MFSLHPTTCGPIHPSAGFSAQRKPSFSFSTSTCRYREPEYESETEQKVGPLTQKVASEPVTDLVAPAAVIKLTWEAAVAKQIRRAALEKYARPEATDTASNQPFMVAIVGIPGSGKSTSSSILTGLLEDVGCLLMPFDGYHYPVKTLKKFEDPEDAIYRRGAPDTFDVKALKNDLETMRFGDRNVVKVPGFDHAVGDPEPDAHTFDRDEHRVIITEGLYLLHDEDGWEEVKDYFDMTIFVNADVDVCVDRLKERNLCIPGYTAEEIEIRCDVVDRVNAEIVNKSQARASLVVESAASIPPC
jgi:pantothenate kinase